MEKMDDCPQPPQLLLRCCIQEKEKGRDKLQGNKNGCNYWRGGFAVVAVDRVENR